MNIHVLLKKEEIREAEMNHHKIAVVYDVLFATTTIGACLEAGALSVRPVLHEQEARAYYETIDPAVYEMAGESEGHLMEAFLMPTPSALSECVQGKHVILSTTNGTVAIRRLAQAKDVYAASLRNTPAVVETILNQYEGETIVVVCAGSANQFNMEDFYGVGYFVSIMSEKVPEVVLSDSAIAAKLLYEQYAQEATTILCSSRVGRAVVAEGYVDEIQFSSEKNCTAIVPRFVAGKLVV